MYIYIYIYIYIYKVQWVTLLKGDLKAPFSISTTQRCTGGHYSIHGFYDHWRALNSLGQ